tara:strand:- start:527 stop:1189 length:663 start_codon:yes stop_codon:yes gene_type:complete
MSKASDTLNAIKSALGMEVEVKLATMKLDDGVTVLEADAFEMGNAVTIVTEDEQRIALPVGEYNLEDGRLLTVKEEGIIDSVIEKEEEVKEEAPAQEAEPVVEEEVAASDKPTETVATPKKVIEAISKESYFSSEDMEKIGNLIDIKLAEFKNNLTLSTDVQNEEKEEKEEKVELTSEDVAAAKPITHNPENKTKGAGVKYAQNRHQSTLDRVMEKICNI